jgi:DHA1 family inner membrane transport protein
MQTLSQPRSVAHQRRDRGHRSNAVVLVGLLLGTFVGGSAEVLTVGLLPLLSRGLGVSAATTGSLFSAYAIGLAVGAPVLTTLTVHLNRRMVLVGSMGLFTALVVSPAVVPDVRWFLATRLMTGALEGLFLAAAFTTATSLVVPEHAGRAMSVVIAGFSLSTVVGLPTSVLVGSVLGWRGALLMIGGFALAVTGFLAVVAPSVPSSRSTGGGALRQALAPPVLAMLAFAVVLFAASGAMTSYLMPVLEQVTGVSGAWTSSILVVYGLANVAGSFLGGRLADIDAARALVVVALGLATSGAFLFLSRGDPLLAVSAILLWAVAAASAPPSVQYRAVNLAGPAAAIVTSLPASAASAGIALGSTASGVAYAARGPAAVILTALLVALGALALALATRRLRPPLGATPILCGGERTPDPIRGGPVGDFGAVISTKGQAHVPHPDLAALTPWRHTAAGRPRCL